MAINLGSVLWIENLSYDAHDYRRFLRDLADGTEGVFGPTDLAVAQRAAGVNMSVDVAVGGVIILGDQFANQGAYYGHNGTVGNVTIPASDGSNPRRDLIVAYVQDQEGSGGTDQGSIDVVTGTPASTPADPAQPANSALLARVAVGAGVASINSGNITDLRALNALASRGRGVLGDKDFGAVTSTINGSTGQSLVGSDFTVTLQKGRTIRYAATVRLSSTIANDIYDLTIRRDGAIQTVFPVLLGPANTILGFTVELCIPTGAAGSHNFDMHAVRSTGTGLGTVGSASHCTLEDIGGTV